MTILSDLEIRQLCLDSDGMIWPFSDKLISETLSKEKLISYGLSSYGYDVRLANELFVFHNVNGGILDPKKPDSSCYIPMSGTSNFIIPPHGFALGRTVEYIRMPRDCLAICMGKSSYARCGIIVNVTPLEPEWEGHITIEISNTASIPARVYYDEGIAQLLFLRSNMNCQTSYRDRKGKYQGQRGITLAKV